MLWLLVLPLLFLFPYLSQYIYLPGSEYSDLLVSHIPNAIFLKQSLATWRAIPFWSDNILGGYPFIANPLSGIWYPPGWLAIFLPVPFGFNLTMLLHLLWGGTGMYFLLRSKRISSSAALIGAVVFVAMPKLIAHLAAGHVTLIYAISWTPWLLLATRQAITSRKVFKILVPGIIFALIILADVRWAVYTGLLWISYSVYQTIDNFVPAVETSQRSLPFSFTGFLKNWLVRIIPQASIAGLLCSPFLIPFFGFVRLSTRSSLASNDNLTLSLPPARIIGLLYPSLGDNAEWTVYVGGITLAIFLFVLFIPRLRNQCGYWLGVVFICFLLAMGSSIPGVGFVESLPILNYLRVPARWLFLAGFSFAIITAYGVESLSLDLPYDRLIKKLNPIVIPIILSTFTIFLTGGVAALTHSLPINFAWGCGAILIACLILIFRLTEKINPTAFWGLVFTLLLVDLTGVNWLSISPKVSPSQPEGQRDLASYLKTQSDYFRVYSPSYSLPQELAAQANIQLADGVDPMQLGAYRKYMVFATGVPNNNYSVTLPPYKSGDPQVDNRLAVPNARLLGQLNVRFVASEFPLSSDGLQRIATFGDTILYRNTFTYPRAWVSIEKEGQPADIQVARIVNYQPNEMTIHADGPGKLILSEVNYPGWKAWIDGKNAEIVSTDGLFRSVTLLPGTHIVKFSFSPPGLPLGFSLAGIGVLILIGSALIQKTRYR